MTATLSTRLRELLEQDGGCAICKPSPCPFCGCEASDDPDVEQVQSYQQIGGGIAHVYCEKCGAEGPHEKSRKAAITAWNTRTDPLRAIMPEVIEALEGMGK